MKTICKKELCTACTACFNICPKHCIRMESDTEGFLYPVIDEVQCINCKLCEKACPILNEQYKNNSNVTYGVINKNNIERQASSSGGYFPLVAKYVIDNGGVVIGSSFDKDFNLEHIIVDNLEELYKLQGSKYVQSQLDDIFFKAKNYLESGKLVLFTGTPCQIAGLYSFLNRDYENLIMQDIICHGVPSPLVWKKYLTYHKEKNNKKITNIKFRYKDESWYRYKIYIEFDNGEKYEKFYQEDTYMNLYLRDYSIRPSCYQCKSKRIPRVSDYTLGDFWGVDKVLPSMYDDKGTSLVIINSEVGKRLIESLKDEIIMEEVDTSEALLHNPSAQYSAKQPKNRELFFQKLEDYNFQGLADSFLRKTFINKIRDRIFR